MERVYNYRTVLKNEVSVRRGPMVKLFKNKTVFVLGYGSLTHSHGWLNRGMDEPPKISDLIECKVKGFERGPFGLYGLTHFYGVIRRSAASMNGVLGQVHDLIDWVHLMQTECIAGLTSAVNYRVVDITDDIFDIKGKLPDNAVVHMVVNRPGNREQILRAWPARNYYRYCWQGVKRERTPEFADYFLSHGGYRSDAGAEQFIEDLRAKSPGR